MWNNPFIQFFISKGAYLIIFVIINFAPITIQAQKQVDILDDDASMQVMKRAMQKIYNFEFDEADQIINQLEIKLPNHPSINLLKAFETFWQYKPLEKDTDPFTEFESELNSTIEKCEKRFDEEEEDVEATFFSMAAYGYLAQLYAENGENMKALSMAKSAYAYLLDGFDLMETYPEFYFSSGIYNYYRVKYPEENPFYKPFVWVFKSGDKDEGLSMLKKGAEKAVFTKAESLNYLAHIYLHYESDPASAFTYAQKLISLYPNNIVFNILYAEALLNLDKPDAALNTIIKIMKSDRVYHQFVGKVLEGVYFYRKGKYTESVTILTAAEKQISTIKSYDLAHYTSLLYLFKGKSHEAMHQNDKALSAYKASVKAANYSPIRNEAQKLADAL